MPRSRKKPTRPGPPQFFQQKAAPVTRITTGNLAVYGLPRRSADSAPTQIVVECFEGGGNLPRNATSFLEPFKDLDIKEEFNAVAAVAESILDSLKALRPGGVEIEFGVELGGGLGIPLVTHGEAKANFKVTLKWMSQEKGSG